MRQADDQRLAVYVGFDGREPRAYKVATRTLRMHTGIDAQPLMSDALRARGLLWRPEDRRDRRVYDLVSNAHASTDFAVTRFLVPILCQVGWALFVDCDVAFLADVEAELAPLLDPAKAVMCVQHVHEPTTRTKMDGQPQAAYPRKNWSSVVAFNCAHPANRRLTLHDVNTKPGLWLHQFAWLHDSEIGELPGRFNWLVGEQLEPEACVVAHWTLGGPFTPQWPGGPHDDRWLELELACSVQPVGGTYEQSR